MAFPSLILTIYTTTVDDNTPPPIMLTSHIFKLIQTRRDSDYTGIPNTTIPLIFKVITITDFDTNSLNMTSSQIMTLTPRIWQTHRLRPNTLNMTYPQIITPSMFTFTIIMTQTLQLWQSLIHMNKHDSFFETMYNFKSLLPIEIDELHIDVYMCCAKKQNKNKLFNRSTLENAK